MPPPPDELIVVANREPYRHERQPDGRLVAARSASGVVNAVEPLLLKHGGVWIGEGVGEADRETATDRDGLLVPPSAPRYRLRRVWLSELERHGYYEGFANSGLWPLCHRTSVEPVFYPAHFHAYELANRRFADAVSDEARRRAPVVLVQDYHFALAPQLIRRQLPLAHISTFWHIPWPRPETFAQCPWSRALLDGLLGSSSLGFQTAGDRDQFLAAVEHLLRLDVDHEAHAIVHRGRRITVNVCPASVEWPGNWANGPSVAACRRAVRQQLALDDDVVLGVGVDRLDYTKGIEQKLLAVEWLLERRPDLVDRLVFAQLAEPSRDGLTPYRHTRSRVLETAMRINRRFSRCDSAGPIRLLEGHHAPATVARFYRAGDFCYVGSLHDGMNLVSKEFVSARDDEQGVLVLSTFAGASHELTDAVVINPYDLDQAARALTTAIEMSPAEQKRRMRRMRGVVASASAEHWAAQLLAHVVGQPDREVESDPASVRTLADRLNPPPLVASDASAF